MTARPITLDIWYPAKNVVGRTPEPYIDTATATQLSKFQGIPDTGETASHSFRDAPAKPGSFPTVIFNHGYASFTRQNFSLCQELASHGFVVIAIGHPGDSLIARDAAGALLPFDGDNPIYRRSMDAMTVNPRAIATALSKHLRAQRNASSLMLYEQASKALANTAPYSFYEPGLRAWVLDTRFVIAALTQVPGADLTRVTVMGHSLGGAVSQELARDQVPGVIGLVNLDSPWLRYGDDTRSLRTPALMLLSTEYKIEGVDVGLHGSFDVPLAAHSPGAHVLEIAGTGHFNFSDLSYIPLLKYITPVLGSVDGEDMMLWQNKAVLTFVQRVNTGRDQSQPLLAPDARIRQTWFAVRP